MPTVKELMMSLGKEKMVEKVVRVTHPDIKATVSEDAAIKKLNKVDRLRKLCSGCETGKYKRIGFIVGTPGTGSGRNFHSVTLLGGTVNKTTEGNYTITGLDLELTFTECAKHGVDVTKRAVFSKIDDKHKVYRSYRIDRILDGTIVYA